MADNAGFEKKKAGIPIGWWIGGGAALAAIVWWYIRNRSNQTTAANNTTASNSSNSTTDTSGLATNQYEVLLSQLRDIQGQEGSETNPAVPVPAGTPSTLPAINPVTNPTIPPGTSTQAQPPPTAQPTPSSNTQNTVTVQAYPAWNSTLWGIAQKEYGDGSQYPKIYTANQNLIVGQEMAHGLSSAQAQQKKFIYPGEVLTIP